MVGMNKYAGKDKRAARRRIEAMKKFYTRKVENKKKKVEPDIDDTDDD